VVELEQAATSTTRARPTTAAIPARRVRGVSGCAATTCLRSA
jgi:hypothetical protein